MGEQLGIQRSFNFYILEPAKILEQAFRCPVGAFM